MSARVGTMPRSIRVHRWTRAHMSGYIDGELPEAQRRRVDEHIHRCPRCHNLLAGLVRTVAALNELGSAGKRDVASGVISSLRSHR